MLHVSALLSHHQACLIVINIVVVLTGSTLCFTISRLSDALV